MSPRDKHQFLEDDLEDRKRKNQFRTLGMLEPAGNPAFIRKNNRELVNFSSNDYLGLSRHPLLKERAAEFARKYGAGSAASRLVSGNFTIHQHLEEKLAEFLGAEAVLLFNSGYQANSTLIATLAHRKSTVFTDKLSHNSLLQGALMSRASLKRFGHNDLDHLKKLLKSAGQNNRSRRSLIVTETVFSMDGDRSDIDELRTLAGTYGSLLFLDDAHAVGVWGEGGRGLAPHDGSADIVLGTFGKAFGTFGAFVACSEQMKDYLVNFCPGFIYTTALPPPVIGAIDAALELVPGLNTERKILHDRTRAFRKSLNTMGFDTGKSDSQIIPIIIGEEAETVRLTEVLEEKGFFTTAIRPPTVPENSSRIRVTLSSAHSDGQIDTFLSILQKESNRG